MHTCWILPWLREVDAILTLMLKSSISFINLFKTYSIEPINVIGDYNEKQKQIRRPVSKQQGSKLCLSSPRTKGHIPAALSTGQYTFAPKKT